MERTEKCLYKARDLINYLNQCGAVLDDRRKDHSGYCSSVCSSSPDRLPNLLEIELAESQTQSSFSQYSDSRDSFLNDGQISSASPVRDSRSDETCRVFTTDSHDLIPNIKLLIKELLNHFKTSSPSYPKVKYELNVLLEKIENVGKNADFRTLYNKLTTLSKHLNIPLEEEPFGKELGPEKRVESSTVQSNVDSLVDIAVASPLGKEQNALVNSPHKEGLLLSVPGMKPLSNNAAFTAVPDTDLSLSPTGDNSLNLRQEVAPSYSKIRKVSRSNLATEEPSSNCVSSTSTSYITRNLEEDVSIVYVKPGSERSNILKSTDLNRSLNAFNEIKSSNLLSTSKTKNTNPAKIVFKKITSRSGSTVVLCDLDAGNTSSNEKVNSNSCVSHGQTCNSSEEIVTIQSSQKPDVVNENGDNDEEISISTVKPAVKKNSILETAHLNTSEVSKTTSPSTMSTCQSIETLSPIITVKKFAFDNLSEAELPLPARETLDILNKNTIVSNVTTGEISQPADPIVDGTSIDIIMVEENQDNEKEFQAIMKKSASEDKNLEPNKISFAARKTIITPSSVVKVNTKKKINKKLLLSLLRKVRESNITDQSEPFSIAPDGFKQVSDDNDKISNQENIHLNVSGKTVRAKRQFIGIPITKAWDKLDEKTVNTIKEQVNELLSKENAGAVNSVKLVPGNKQSHNGVSEDIAEKKGHEIVTSDNADRMDSPPETSCNIQENPFITDTALNASSDTQVNALRVDSADVCGRTQNKEPSTASSGSVPPRSMNQLTYSKLCVLEENSIPVHIKDYITRVVPEAPSSKLLVIKENRENLSQSRNSAGLPNDSGEDPSKIEPIVTINSGNNEITIYGASNENIPPRVKNFIQQVAPETKKLLVVKEVTKSAFYEPSVCEMGNTDECHIEKTTDPGPKSIEPFEKVVICPAPLKFPVPIKIVPEKSKTSPVICGGTRLPPTTRPPIPRLPGQRLEKRHLNDEGKVLFDEYRKLKNTNRGLKDRIRKLKQLVKDPPKLKYTRVLKELDKYLPPEAYALVSTLLLKKALGTKGRGMRFSEEMKKVAVSLYLAGPKVYKSWAAIFSLPGRCTIKKWLNHYLTLAIPASTCEDSEAQTQPNDQNNRSTNSSVESDEESLSEDDVEDSSEDEARESNLYDEMNEFINFR